MNPLYHALICFLVKLVFSIKKSRSSFVSFCLLLDPPILASVTSPLLWLHSTQCQQQRVVVVLHSVIVSSTTRHVMSCHVMTLHVTSYVRLYTVNSRGTCYML